MTELFTSHIYRSRAGTPAQAFCAHWPGEAVSGDKQYEEGKLLVCYME